MSTTTNQKPILAITMGDPGGIGPEIIAKALAHADVYDQARPLVLALPVNRCTPPLVERLREILVTHPGQAEVHVKLLNGSKSTMLRLGPFKVTPTTALKGDLKALLGPQAFAS